MLAIDLCYIITYIVEGLIIYRYFTTIYESKVKKAYAITFYILVYGIIVNGKLKYTDFRQ